MDIKDLSKEEIIDLIKKGEVSAGDLTDAGICPTCFNKENGNVLYGDNEDKVLFEDEDFECFLVGNPRAQGHTAISTKKHFKDMLEADEKTVEKITLLSHKAMRALKEVYGAESVYLCTMCDGPMNHFHVQLIPRYEYEKRGSKNFVKPRQEYVEDKEKIEAMRSKLGYKEKEITRKEDGEER